MCIKLYFEIKLEVVFHFEFKVHILPGLGVVFFFFNEHYILGGNLYETHTHTECQLQPNLSCLHIHRGKSLLVNLGEDSLRLQLYKIKQISPN